MAVKDFLRSVLPVWASPAKAKAISVQERNRQVLLSQFTSDSFPEFSLQSGSGQHVNEKTALGIPAFYRGVKVIAETISSLKWEVQDTDADGNITQRPTHPVYRLLTEPSPRYNKITFLETLVAYSVIRGNGYAYIRRNPSTLRPIELRLLDPRNVEPYINQEGELRYKMYSGRGLQRSLEVVEHDNMIHISNMVMDEDHIEGLSPLSVFRNSLGLPMAMTEWAGKTFKDGSPLQGLLSTDAALTREQLDQATDQWKKQLSKGNTPILPGGLKFQAITLSPEDALFVENYQLTVGEVSRILGVPPPFLSDLERATFSNIEELGRWLVTYTIRPWVKRIEAEFNRKLLYEREKGKTRVRGSMESLLRGNMQNQADFLQKMVIGGVMSRNEARKYIGLNSREGLDEMPMPVQFQQGANDTSDEQEQDEN